MSCVQRWTCRLRSSCEQQAANAGTTAALRAVHDVHPGIGVTVGKVPERCALWRNQFMDKACKKCLSRTPCLGRFRIHTRHYFTCCKCFHPKNGLLFPFCRSTLSSWQLLGRGFLDRTRTGLAGRSFISSVLQTPAKTPASWTLLGPVHLPYLRSQAAFHMFGTSFGSGSKNISRLCRYIQVYESYVDPVGGGVPD